MHFPQNVFYWIGEKIGSFWRQISFLQIAIILILAMALVEILPRWRPPVYPFVTTGQIFVDSPEVYTRERLVNDRYSQDHWLRSRLDDLDRAEDFITHRSATRTSAAVGDDGAALPDPLADVALSFGDELEIRAGIRAELRQKILENLLDDRHDLSGNSLYGFKFDTSVVAGWNTQRPAYVKIKFIANEFAELTMRELRNGVQRERPAQLSDFLLASLSEEHQLHADFLAYNQLYEDWLDNIRNRLDRYVNAAAGTGSFACADDTAEQQDLDQTVLEQVARDAIESVLSVPPGEYTFQQLTNRTTTGTDQGQSAIYKVQLNGLWRELIALEFRPRPGDTCANLPLFEVREYSVNLFLFDRTNGSQAFIPEWAQSRNYDEYLFGADNSQIVVTTLKTPRGTPRDGLLFENNLYPTEFFKRAVAANQARVTGDPVESDVWNALRVFRFCNSGNPANSCAVDDTYYTMRVSVGALSLIQRLASQDAYSYAILPETNATGEVVNRIGAFSSKGFWGDIATTVGASFSDSSSGTRKQVIGFSDSSTSEQGAIEFGWVLDPSLTGGHIQSNQMALISVPASISEIKFEITRGWINGRGEMVPSEEDYVVSVALPPDFGAFETIIFDRSDDVRRQPVIIDEFLSNSEKTGQEVFVCVENTILIPGQRLWRSTEVTLGSYSADKIVVMPNMEGIVAVFERLPAHLARPQNNAGDKRRDLPQRLRLRVWTSEGVDTSSRAFLPRYPTDAAIEHCDDFSAGSD